MILTHTLTHTLNFKINKFMLFRRLIIMLSIEIYQNFDRCSVCYSKCGPKLMNIISISYYECHFDLVVRSKGKSS